MLKPHSAQRHCFPYPAHRLGLHPKKYRLGNPLVQRESLEIFNPPVRIDPIAALPATQRHSPVRERLGIPEVFHPDGSNGGNTGTEGNRETVGNNHQFRQSEDLAMPPNLP